MKHRLDHQTGLAKANVLKRIKNSLGTVPFLRASFSRIVRKLNLTKNISENPFAENHITVKERIIYELNYDNLGIVLSTLVAIFGIIFYIKGWE